MDVRVGFTGRQADRKAAVVGKSPVVEWEHRTFIKRAFQGGDYLLFFQRTWV